MNIVFINYAPNTNTLNFTQMFGDPANPCLLTVTEDGAGNIIFSPGDVNTQINGGAPGAPASFTSTGVSHLMVTWLNNDHTLTFDGVAVPINLTTATLSITDGHGVQDTVFQGSCTFLGPFYHRRFGQGTETINSGTSFV